MFLGLNLKPAHVLSPKDLAVSDGGSPLTALSLLDNLLLNLMLQGFHRMISSLQYLMKICPSFRIPESLPFAAFLDNLANGKRALTLELSGPRCLFCCPGLCYLHIAMILQVEDYFVPGASAVFGFYPVWLLWSQLAHDVLEEVNILICKSRSSLASSILSKLLPPPFSQ